MHAIGDEHYQLYHKVGLAQRERSPLGPGRT